MAAARRPQLARQPGGGTRLSSGSALGFDFGLRRIGVASGDTLTRSAAPLAAITRGARGPDWPAIERLLAAADRFAAALAHRAAVAVARVDERGSTQEAAAELKRRRAAGALRRRVQRQDIDSLAAAIILGRWLRGEY